MLLPRLITAVVGIPLMLLSIYWGGLPFLIVMMGVVFLALQEFFYIAEKGNYSVRPVTGIVTGMLIFISVYLNATKIGPLSDNQGTAALITLLIIPLFAMEIIKKQPQKAIERMGLTFFGAFFISWTLGHLVLIRNLRPDGLLFSLFLVLLIWTLDTGAYFVGRKFGRNRLSESISPKKTVEGAIGGVITAVVVGLICRLIFLKHIFSIPETIIISVAISIVSQFSDLAESLIKRDAGLKDSSDLLPGHGGMLDRFDSFLFTAPLFYYYLVVFKNI
ncbi:MAG TPA: hypothetical protein DEE98_00935 [Elusimicrobia bacterium]|nr:MAG: hypothetical protein A2278_03545 [Elusimicrobia bacterium RIFOXYA12_FULL_49_49]OGS10244.1 MAG: hypothetical protein A2204_05130 [Elusimicrobia bacterium RIFOXYA1_FULL_47_7]OGS11236.1 MAG: hypothetical protein A2386_01920 [Elusimicrobia bacterium RIFOXYB1_FULL_48_9]OGS15633.1 MAG: hypothetical protein A2251_03800 [Elusimicrobia bacterium RIFOXYA2_FULL_47_53]OGS26811.1 MAG: hypothetical protein A2339_07180 [Elusimicrobia bacterium RIFOXYB12_FULL_50_12]OGS30732.1 MAG: hypothetical protein